MKLNMKLIITMLIVLAVIINPIFWGFAIATGLGGMEK
jgi:hypothetical protein